MKNYKVWGWFGAAALGVILAGCGSGSSSNANVRLANATLTHASLDLLINSSSSVTGVAADTISNYASPSSGSETLQVNDSTSSTALATTVPTLASGLHYALVAYESGGAVQTVVLSEDFVAPTSGTAQLRVYNVAPDSGKLDVYITPHSTPVMPLTGLTPTYSFTTNITTPLLTYSPTSYDVQVTGYGNQSDVRAIITNVTLTNQEIATVLLTPASGGKLLNGSVVIQQGAYSAERNTYTRVRLASAVAGGVLVGANAVPTNPNSTTPPQSTVVIDPGSVSPQFGLYTLVPAASTLNINVANGSVQAPSNGLIAGADMTLVVFGGGTAPGGGVAPVSANLITDDNRLPTDSTTVKLNVINGLTSTGGGTVTLNANSTPVGGSVALGAASSYVSIPSSTVATNIKVFSSLHGLLINDSTNLLNANAVYTILVGGDYLVYAANPSANPSALQLVLQSQQ